MRPLLYAACSVLGLLAACQASPPSSSAAAPATGTTASAAAARAPAASAAQRFGAPITATRAVALADIAASPSAYADGIVKTEGTISAVCQAAGCWMEITDSASKAHVKMAGHAFLVPKSSSGRRAVVQAKVLTAAAPSACAGHCEGASAGGACQGGACGEGATGTEAKADKVQLEATGVEIL